MPALYRIRVKEIDREKAFIILNVKTINLDANELSSRSVRNTGFVLALLDNIKLENTPIREYISYEEMYDAAWQQKYAKAYIQEFKIKDVWMPIDDEIMKTYNETPELWQEANVEITCTDPAWIKHLNLEDSWESYAFLVTQTFDDCSPMKYEPKT